jgi:hypothetical protein
LVSFKLPPSVLLDLQWDAESLSHPTTNFNAAAPTNSTEKEAQNSTRHYGRVCELMSLRYYYCVKRRRRVVHTILKNYGMAQTCVWGCSSSAVSSLRLRRCSTRELAFPPVKIAGPKSNSGHTPLSKGSIRVHKEAVKLLFTTAIIGNILG